MLKWFILILATGLFPGTGVTQQFTDQVLYNIIIDKPEEERTKIHFEVVIEGSENKKGRTIRMDSKDEFIYHLLEDISSLPDERNNILVYIHGMFGSNRWNYSHALGMLYKAYVIPEVSNISRILSVKWPGNSLEYKDNKARVPLIADELKNILIDIIRQVQLVDILNPTFSTEFDIIAHSLGNELFKEVIAQIKGEQLNFPMFDQVILAAPDLDVNVLDAKGPLSGLEYLAHGTQLYFSRRDITLGVSRNLNRKDRMGIIGPVDSTSFWKGLVFVDVSDVKDEPNFGERLSGHSYYRSSARATNDILCALMGKKGDCQADRKVIDLSKNLYALEQ